MNKKIKTILSFVVLVLVLGSGFWYFQYRQKPSQEVAQKTIDYLNNQLLPEELTASLIDVKEKENVIEIRFNVGQSEYTSYVTKNGELFFIEGIELNEEINIQNSQSDSTEEIPKKEKPDVELFVMSYCPFGNQAEDTMEPVYDLLSDDINFDVHYIVSVQEDKIQSLHGQEEVDQNMREVCVKNKYGMDSFWDFITYVNENCGSGGVCWKEAADEIGVNSQEIQSCVNENGLEYMKENAQISKEAGATGSPTLILNGIKMDTSDPINYEYDAAIYEYGNPEAYKQAICSVFTEEAKPESCSQVLPVLDSSSSSGGSC